MDVLDDGEVVIQHLIEVKSGSKRIVDVFRVSSDGQKVESFNIFNNFTIHFFFQRLFIIDQIEDSIIHILKVKVHFHYLLIMNNIHLIHYPNNFIINIVEHGSELMPCFIPVPTLDKTLS